MAAAETQNLSMDEGTDITWTVTITDSAGDPVNITGYSFLFTVKKCRNDSDDNAIIKKTFTTHSDPTNGVTEITLADTDTDNIHGVFLYDYRWTDTSNNIRAVFKGSLEIEQRIGDSFG